MFDSGILHLLHAVGIVGAVGRLAPDRIADRLGRYSAVPATLVEGAIFILLRAQSADGRLLWIRVLLWGKSFLGRCGLSVTIIAGVFQTCIRSAANGLVRAIVRWSASCDGPSFG
jgi:hypothetical protein